MNIDLDMDWTTTTAHGAAGAGAGRAVTARLVEYAPGRRVALAPHTTIELIEHPAPLPVPGAANYSCGLLAWQDRRLPMMDLHALLTGQASTRASVHRYALVTAYQRAGGSTPEYGAIGMSVLPETISVGDEAFCDLPADHAIWPLVSASCFHFRGQAIPVIDTLALFGSYHAGSW